MSGEAAASSNSVVELRVHGVSGTPPEEILKCPTELLERVAGNNAAGFFRCRPCCDGQSEKTVAAELNGQPIPITQEAYSWGGLTSGPAARAAWLLFLPFLLINLAHWMLPPSKTGRGAAMISVALLRLIGLSFTLLLMLASAQVAMDIVGWQCSAVAHCGAKLGPATFLIHASSGLRLAVTAIPVALMPGALLLLGRANSKGPRPLGRANPKGVRPPAVDTPPQPAVVTDDKPPLEDQYFWVPDDSMKRLRGCHVMAWSSGLAAVTLAPPVKYADLSGLYWACVGLLIVNIIVLASAVTMTASTPITGRGGPSADQWSRPIRWFQGAAVVILAASLIVVACTQTVNYPPPPTAMPFLQDTITKWIIPIQLALLFVLFGSTAWCMHAGRGAAKAIGRALLRPWRLVFRLIRGQSGTADTALGDAYAPTVEGFTAPFVAAIGAIIGGGFSTGIVLWTARYFGTPVRTANAAACEIGFRDSILRSTDRFRTLDDSVAAFLAACDQKRISQLPTLPVSFETQLDSYNLDTPIIVPGAAFATALVFGVLLVALVIFTITVWRCIIPRWSKANEPDVRLDFKEETIADEDHVRAVATARAWASLPDSVPTILVCFIEVAALAFIGLAVYVGFGMPTTVPLVSNLSVVVMSSAAAGLVVLVVATYVSRRARRVVGILWDVITFWPRANHPLTPPCYAERTVPDLRGQLEYLTSVDNKRVILSGHSQGSIISAATLLQADATDSAHVAFLTSGCMLRRLYAMNFPAYFGRKTLEVLEQKEYHRWINMWARTDFLGGWVFSRGTHDIRKSVIDVDYELRDVTSLNREPRGDYPAICRHSGYWKRDEYVTAIAILAATVPTTTSPPDHPGGQVPPSGATPGINPHTRGR